MFNYDFTNYKTFIVQKIYSSVTCSNLHMIIFFLQYFLILFASTKSLEKIQEKSDSIDIRFGTIMNSEMINSGFSEVLTVCFLRLKYFNNSFLFFVESELFNVWTLIITCLPTCLEENFSVQEAWNVFQDQCQGQRLGQVLFHIVLMFFSVSLKWPRRKMLS